MDLYYHLVANNTYAMKVRTSDSSNICIDGWTDQFFKGGSDLLSGLLVPKFPSVIGFVRGYGGGWGCRVSGIPSILKAILLVALMCNYIYRCIF